MLRLHIRHASPGTPKPGRGGLPMTAQRFVLRLENQMSIAANIATALAALMWLA
jgi:hypothetical protein